MHVRKDLHTFKKKSEAHDKNTRSKNKLIQPYTRLSKIQNSFMGLSVRMYNKIPETITNMPINKFKIIVKRNLMQKAYFCINDYLLDKTAWSDITPGSNE